jgi:hypothetical protein
LVEKPIQDGERLLHALQESGLDPKASFWYFNPELEAWKLMIQLPLMDAGDHLRAYRLVERTRMSVQPEVAISLTDIVPQSRHSLLVGAVRRAVRSLPERAKTGSHYIGATVNNQFIGDVYIYRI